MASLLNGSQRLRPKLLREEICYRPDDFAIDAGTVVKVTPAVDLAGVANGERILHGIDQSFGGLLSETSKTGAIAVSQHLAVLVLKDGVVLVALPPLSLICQLKV